MVNGQKIVRTLTLRGMLLSGLFWFGYCSYVAFTATMLIDYGWSDSAATGLITMMSVVTFLTQPLIGFFSDKQGSVKRQAIWMMLLGSVSLALLPFALKSGSRLLTVCAIIFCTVTVSQAPGIMDAWIVGLNQEYPALNYGLVRGTGSFAYAVSSQLMGTLTVAFGTPARLWVGGAACLLGFLAAVSLQDVKPAPKKEQSEKLTGKAAVKMLFSSKSYRLLLFVAFCLLLGSVSLVTLLQLCIRDFGGSASEIGTVSAVCAIIEVPAMFTMAYFIHRFGESKLILFATICYVIRMFLTASATSVTALILLQLLQGVTYSVFVPAAISYLPKCVDPRIRSTAVTFYTAVTGSVTSIIGNLITTLFLSAGVQARWIIAFFGLTSLIGLIGTLIGKKRGIW